MQLSTLLSWQRIRIWLLAALILWAVVGVLILFFMGKHDAPAASVLTVVAPVNNEDFGKYLADHNDVLAPFFEKNRQDVVKQGVPLLIKVMGDIILINMALGWVLDVAIAFGFSSLYAPLYAKPQQAVLFASWRLGLDIVVFIMGSFVSFGLEQFGGGAFIPLGVIIGVFVIIDILVQSFLVANLYGTGAVVSTVFYILLIAVHILVGVIVSGSLIKARVSVMLAQFVDVQSVTEQLVLEGRKMRREREMSDSDRETAKEALTAAQGRLADLNRQEEELRKDIEAKQAAEAYVYGRIIRIRAQGDLATARDQITEFMVKFPNGELIGTAREQLALINQDLANQAARTKQAETDAAAAIANARADLLARADRGEVTLSEMRRALIGKKQSDVTALFGNPTETGPSRWGYSKQMVINLMTGEKSGLAVYFAVGKVQSVDYYYGR